MFMHLRNVLLMAQSQAGILCGRVTGASEFSSELIKIPTVKRLNLSSPTKFKKRTFFLQHEEDSQSNDRTSSAQLSEPEVNLFSPDESLVKVMVTSPAKSLKAYLFSYNESLGKVPVTSPDESLKVNFFSPNESLVKVSVDFSSPDKSLKEVK